MQKTSKVKFDSNQRPEIKLGTLVTDSNEDVWIVYSAYNASNCYTYYNTLCVTRSCSAVNLYCDKHNKICSNSAYTCLQNNGFKVLIGSVTITQK